jgi:hypothetical protein
MRFQRFAKVALGEVVAIDVREIERGDAQFQRLLDPAHALGHAEIPAGDAPEAGDDGRHGEIGMNHGRRGVEVAVEGESASGAQVKPFSCAATRA